MELRTLILGGGHQWDRKPPASEHDIAALEAETTVPLPAEYLALFRLSDGGEGEFAGYPGYVRIWSARKAVDYNDGYQMQKWLPGFVGFGDDGGLEMVGFDTRHGQPYPVSAVPFAPMEWSATMGTVPDFMAFIRQLLPTAPDAEQAAALDGGI